MEPSQLLDSVQKEFPHKQFRLSKDGSFVLELCGGKWVRKCKHGRRRSRCKECCGGSICEHGRIRSRCKECEGGSICEHVRRRSICKECRGSSICEHGRQRSQCKECEGGSICEHGRIRSRCKDCGGISICEHGRQRSQCKECRGSSICEHDRHRSSCKDCRGSSICEHGRIRSKCKECGGISICEHGRIRSKCKECGGGSICEHGRIRSSCKECRGGSICEHDRQRSSCKECCSVTCPDCNKILSKHALCRHLKIHGECQNPEGCKLGTPSRLFDFKYCYPCGCYLFGKTPQQKRQDQVFQYLESSFQDQEDIEILYDKPDPSNDSSVKTRADIRIITQHRTIICEIDEQQHKNEAYACVRAKISNVLGSEITRMSVGEHLEDRKKRIRLQENSRMNDMAASGNVTHIVFIRFNPDTWTDENGKMHTKMKNVPEERMETLLNEITSWLDIEKTQEHFAQVVFLYYDGPFRIENFIPLDPSELDNKTTKKSKIANE